MNKFILSTCLLFCYFLPTFAQAARTEAADTVTTETPDTKEARRQRVAQRNLHYNILGGPGYTPDFGVVLGATALMTFRTAPEDTLLQRSVVPLTLAYMFKGSGVNLMVRPQFFFRALVISVSGARKRSVAFILALSAMLDNELVCKLKRAFRLHSSDFFLFLCGAKSMNSF